MARLGEGGYGRDASGSGVGMMSAPRSGSLGGPDGRTGSVTTIHRGSAHCIRRPGGPEARRPKDPEAHRRAVPAPAPVQGYLSRPGGNPSPVRSGPPRAQKAVSVSRIPVGAVSWM
ncbi:hypothetical protein GCM10010129_03630 [Streptomyces fumigatiscleroticus]|nr:hypothetical protein GCM10010129_03630 [Streptomyces fumigatiscleroticus]